MEDSNVVFNFDDQVEKDTFHHLIAPGDKSNRVLKHLKLDLGNWFTEDLLTIEKGYEKVKYLLVLADDNVDISNLPAEYSDEKMPRENIFVFDIGAKPAPNKWEGVFSYLWIPQKNQYTTLKNLFQLYYHDILSGNGLVCFDYNDWKISVRGRNELSICKIKLDSDLRRRIKKIPRKFLLNGKNVLTIGSHSIKGQFLTKVMKPINKIDTMLDVNTETHLSILARELPKSESYVAMLHFEPLKY